MRLTRVVAIAVFAAILALAAFGGWQAHRRAEAEANIPFESAKLMSEQFAKAASLRVGVLSGEVVAAAADPGPGGWLPSNLKRRLPYSVDYHVDLRNLPQSAFRWNAKTRTMTVTVPDVVPGAPNIDESVAARDVPSGLIVTRGASARLEQQVSARSTAIVRSAALASNNIDRARANARTAIAGLVRAPLAAAGLGQVEVVVRLPQDAPRTPEQWDESRPLTEVLNQR